jgi:hypothetical protein
MVCMDTQKHYGSFVVIDDVLEKKIVDGQLEVFHIIWI